MNNLSSYCGLVDARISASDKDLPVIKQNLGTTVFQQLPISNWNFGIEEK